LDYDSLIRILKLQEQKIREASGFRALITQQAVCKHPDDARIRALYIHAKMQHGSSALKIKTDLANLKNMDNGLEELEKLPLTKKQILKMMFDLL
jgi:O-glycosyl hydrolase